MTHEVTPPTETYLPHPTRMKGKLMRKNSVTRMDQASTTRTIDLGANHGTALVAQVIKGFQYRSTDAETADQETKRDWQEIIAAKVQDLHNDIAALMENITSYDKTYGPIPGHAPVMAQIAEAGEALLGVAQEHDETWIAEQAELHQRYLDKMIMGREPRDFC